MGKIRKIKPGTELDVDGIRLRIRFMSKVRAGPCWLWTAYTDKDGYDPSKSRRAS